MIRLIASTTIPSSPTKGKTVKWPLNSAQTRPTPWLGLLERRQPNRAHLWPLCNQILRKQFMISIVPLLAVVPVPMCRKCTFGFCTRRLVERKLQMNPQMPRVSGKNSTCSKLQIHIKPIGFLNQPFYFLKKSFLHLKGWERSLHERILH